MDHGQATGYLSFILKVPVTFLVLLPEPDVTAGRAGCIDKPFKLYGCQHVWVLTIAIALDLGGVESFKACCYNDIGCFNFYFFSYFDLLVLFFSSLVNRVKISGIFSYYLGQLEPKKVAGIFRIFMC